MECQPAAAPQCRQVSKKVRRLFIFVCLSFEKYLYPCCNVSSLPETTFTCLLIDGFPPRAWKQWRGENVQQSWRMCAKSPSSPSATTTRTTATRPRAQRSTPMALPRLHFFEANARWLIISFLFLLKCLVDNHREKDFKKCHQVAIDSYGAPIKPVLQPSSSTPAPICRKVGLGILLKNINIIDIAFIVIITTHFHYRHLFVKRR